MHTEFGKIAEQVAAVSVEKSPLEKRTEEIGRWLGLIALGVCGVWRSWSASCGRGWATSSISSWC